MKSLIKLLLFVLVTQNCFSQKKTDWEEDNLTGKVASFTQTLYEAVERVGKIEKGKRSDNSFENQYKYNKKGNQIEHNKYDLLRVLKYKSTYDKKGKLIEDNQYSDGELNAKWIYKYHEKDNIIEVNEYDSFGNLESKFSKKYNEKYNEKGKLIEVKEYNNEKAYNSKIKLINKYTLKYDDKGNQIEIKTFNSNGGLKDKKTFKYDKKGNQIEYNKYHSDGSLDYTDKYEKGKLIESNQYTDGSLKYKSTYKYEYDKQGNWTKRIDFVNDIPKNIVEREYTYYK